MTAPDGDGGTVDGGTATGSTAARSTAARSTRGTVDGGPVDGGTARRRPVDGGTVDGAARGRRGRLGEGGGLSAREWVEVAVGWQQVAAFAAAAQLEAVAALDTALQPVPTRRAGVVLAAGRRAADELAPALGIAPQAASRLVALARRSAGPGW